MQYKISIKESDDYNTTIEKEMVMIICNARCEDTILKVILGN